LSNEPVGIQIDRRDSEVERECTLRWALCHQGRRM
jgi:hypothetical protein